MLPIEEHKRRIALIVEAAGIEGALRYLNGLQERRFTALYVFAGDTLHNHYLVDRDDPDQIAHPDIPVTASYCVFVRDEAAPFIVKDAATDQRVASHQKRHTVRSYCGVPVFDELGRVFGSLCHFDNQADLKAGDRADEDLLEAVAPILYLALFPQASAGAGLT